MKMIFYKIYLFLVKAARWQYVLGQPAEHAYLLDESFLQGFIALYERPVSKDIVEKWLRVVPKSDAVLWVERKDGEHDPVTYLSSEFLRFGEEWVNEWKKTFRANLALLRDVLQQEQSTQFLICISDDPAACDARIKSAVRI